MTKTTATRATDIYETARENPYVQRLIEDDELRDSLRDAFEAVAIGIRLDDGAHGSGADPVGDRGEIGPKRQGVDRQPSRIGSVIDLTHGSPAPHGWRVEVPCSNLVFLFRTMC